MNRLRSIVCLAMMLLPVAIGPGPGFAVAGAPQVGAISALFDPSFRQVVQRRDDNVGNILFSGMYSGNVDGFQARSFVRPGMVGYGLGWTATIPIFRAGGFFGCVFRQPAGGFYDLQIRPVFQGQAGAPFTVIAVGVGEVFITAGQSNTTNFGLPTGFVPDSRVSSFVDGPGKGIDPSYPGTSWRSGIDPQPVIDLSTGGSPWPTMANNLALALGVPIGLYSVGCGGTSIEEWQPGHIKAPTLVTPQMVLFDRLTNAIEYFTIHGGVRAVLWHQGESDYDLQTSSAVYQAQLQNIINESREVANVPIKWMVAQASSALLTNIPIRAGLEQAQASVVDHLLTFPGPNTDSIGVSYRQVSIDGDFHHFTAAGLEILGGEWGVYVDNIPGFLYRGWLP